MPLLLSSIACVLIMHKTFGSSAIDFLAVSGTVDPKLDIPLLLVILFYNSVLSGKDKEINFHDMLVSFCCGCNSFLTYWSLFWLLLNHHVSGIRDLKK